jgi:hypothetical protein
MCCPPVAIRCNPKSQHLSRCCNSKPQQRSSTQASSAADRNRRSSTQHRRISAAGAIAASSAPFLSHPSRPPSLPPHPSDAYLYLSSPLPLSSYVRHAFLSGRNRPHRPSTLGFPTPHIHTLLIRRALSYAHVFRRAYVCACVSVWCVSLSLCLCLSVCVWLHLLDTHIGRGTWQSDSGSASDEHLWQVCVCVCV